MTYQLIINEFSEYLNVIGYRSNSVRMLMKGVRDFTFWLCKQGVYELDELRYSDLQNYQKYLEHRPNERRAGGLSSKMVRDYLWAVKLLLEQELHRGRLRKNLMSAYPLPACEMVRREVLNPNEIEELYEVCDTVKERLILHLHYGLGLRRMEAQRVNIEDLDAGLQWLQVRRGKNDKGRMLPLVAPIRADIQEYVNDERPETNSLALLINTSGRRQRGASSLRQLKGLLDRAGIVKKVDLHCLRHSVATHLLHNGLEIEKLKVWLGHSHLSSTQNYIHYDSQSVFVSALSTSDR